MKNILTDEMSGIIETDRNDHVVVVGVFDLQKLLTTLKSMNDLMSIGEYDQDDYVEVAVRKGSLTHTLLVRPCGAIGNGWFSLAGWTSQHDYKLSKNWGHPY